MFLAKGRWTDPGGTAIPSQPVEKSEHAPACSPSSKNHFNIDVPRWGMYQMIRTDTFFLLIIEQFIYSVYTIIEKNSAKRLSSTIYAIKNRGGKRNIWA